MRIMAQLSKDKVLVKAFEDGIDIHKFTASRSSGKSIDEITKDERQAAKAAGFGLIYGMASGTLRMYAETGYGVKMTPGEAQETREAFFKTYPDIEKWHRKQMRLVSQDGFSDYWTYKFGEGFVKEKRPAVRTLSGRLRVWPVEKSMSGKLKKVGPVTEAFNSPDQGSGADLLKTAMAWLYEQIVKYGLNADIVGCVHDELIWETKVEYAGIVRDNLENIMVKKALIFLTKVPVEVETYVGPTWAEK